MRPTGRRSSSMQMGRRDPAWIPGAVCNGGFLVENLQGIFGPRCRVAPLILPALPVYLSPKTHPLKPKPLGRSRCSKPLCSPHVNVYKRAPNLSATGRRRAGRGAARRGPPSAHTTHAAARLSSLPVPVTRLLKLGVMCVTVGDVRMNITNTVCDTKGASLQRLRNAPRPSSIGVSLSLSLSQGTHAPTLSLHLCSLPRPSRARVCLISSRRASAAPPGAARCLGRTRQPAMRSAWPAAPPAPAPRSARRCASRRAPRPRRCGYG